jgi:tetratricopeptide (TPR) repeat protein
MKSIDLLYVTSYVLALETKECKRFSTRRSPADVLAEDVYVEALRASCGFARTRDMVAMIVARGNDDDARWISYFYGKLRRARADALEDKDPDAQWFELDRAVIRFGDLPNVGGGPALAIKMGAYIDKAVFLHKAVWRAGNWQSVKITQQLDAAEDILVSADRQLWSWRVRYPLACFLKELTSFPGWTPEANGFQKSAESVSLIPYLQGQIKYRLWMINKDRSAHDNFRARTSPEQQKALQGNLLRDAVTKFAVANCSGLRTADLFMNWGNALAELGQFDDAVDKFRRAGEVAPDDDSSVLNIALALLRKAAERKDVDAGTRAKNRFEAVRAVADHLSWSSTGGPGRPYQNLIDHIAAILDDAEKALFMACVGTPLSNKARATEDPSHHLTRAQIKICVDALRDGMASGAVPEAFKLSK